MTESGVSPNVTMPLLRVPARSRLRGMAADSAERYSQGSSRQ
jgi:hypothetical protein